MNKFEFNLHAIAFNNTAIIDSCKFAVATNKTAALIGPSGCGKTTMLNSIAGLTEFPHLQLPDIHSLGYIFQDPRLIPWLTVAENIKLIKPIATPQEVQKLLEEVRLDDTQDMYPNQLSGGMQKRVSIARAFVNKPDLVLLDEPFSSLDAPTATHLIELVKQLLLHNSASALIVTHNLIEALQLADDLYFLSHKPTRVIKHISNPVNANISAEDAAATLLDTHPNLLSGKP